MLADERLVGVLAAQRDERLGEVLVDHQLAAASAAESFAASRSCSLYQSGNSRLTTLHIGVFWNLASRSCAPASTSAARPAEPAASAPQAGGGGAARRRDRRHLFALLGGAEPLRQRGDGAASARANQPPPREQRQKHDRCRQGAPRPTSGCHRRSLRDADTLRLEGALVGGAAPCARRWPGRARRRLVADAAPRRRSGAWNGNTAGAGRQSAKPATPDEIGRLQMTLRDEGAHFDIRQRAVLLAVAGDVPLDVRLLAGHEILVSLRGADGDHARQHPAHAGLLAWRQCGSSHPASSIGSDRAGRHSPRRLLARTLLRDASRRYNPPQSIQKSRHERGRGMAIEQTLSIIKPDATARNLTGSDKHHHREGGAAYRRPEAGALDAAAGAEVLRGTQRHGRSTTSCARS